MKKQDFINKYGVEAYERWKEQMRQHYAVNREELLVKQKQYRAENREKILEQKKRYNTTPIGRANYLATNYRRIDKKKGFLNVDNQVTKEWIVNNIFTKSCIYCGESDWTKLGCDRIDNNKPHSIDNVVCCCGKCNIERQKMPFDEFMAMHKKTL